MGIFSLGFNTPEGAPHEQGETGKQLKQICLQIGGDIHEKCSVLFFAGPSFAY